MPVTLPEPAHALGYPARQLHEAMGEPMFARFQRWMAGQTCALGEGGELIYYPWDVRRFLDGRPIID